MPMAPSLLTLYGEDRGQFEKKREKIHLSALPFTLLRLVIAPTVKRYLGSHQGNGS